MENVLTGVIFFFLFLFAVLRTVDSTFEANYILTDAKAEQQRIIEANQLTDIAPLLIDFSTDGATLQALYRNDGQQRFYDFTNWDVIVQYYDAESPANYYTKWLAYTDSPPVDNTWSIVGLYRDFSMNRDEAYEPNVWNYGEELVIEVQLNPPPAEGTDVLLKLVTSTGVSISNQAVRNSAPTLVTLNTLSLMSRTSKDIDQTIIEITDNESPPDELIYTITTEPTQGTVNVGTSFTQADINDGLVTYTHTGIGDDIIEVTVSDGEATIGAFTLLITVTNAPPILSVNAKFTIATSTTLEITNSVLSTTDVDNDPTEITYILLSLPTQGVLNLTPTFTQADIDSGTLTYTHSGIGGDSFTFNITDGTDTIGPYVFNIQAQ